MERWYCTLRQRQVRYVRKTLSFSKSDAYHHMVTNWFIIDHNLAVNSSWLFTTYFVTTTKFESLTGEDWQIVATVEVKSGTDPAGALERLGAIQKSFEQTPPRTRNFAVLGVVTSEMRRRLDEMNVAKDFELYQILNDDKSWNDFIMEIFHHTLRIA